MSDEADSRFTADDVRRIASDAVETALARARPPATPAAEPSPYVDTAEAARRMAKKQKTVRGYLQLAPKSGEHAFCWKYGRDWRISYELFERWVRNGGPRLAAMEIGRKQARKGRDR